MLAVSPDGEWLAARVDKLSKKRDKWGAVWLLNLSSREARLVTSGPACGLSEFGVGCLAFSPDSKLLAVCGAAGEFGLGKLRSDYAVQLWDVSTGKESPGFMRHGEAGYVAFSADGRLLATAPPNETLISPPIPFLSYGFNTRTLLGLWDRRTGRLVKLSASYRNYLLGLAFSPDGRQLAVGSYRHISLLDVAKGREVRRLECGSHCEAPTFSPDSRLVAAYGWHGIAYSNHGFIHVWDVDTGKKRDTNPALAATGCSIAFAPASQTLATPQLDNTIPFWDAASGREARRLTFPQGAPCLFVFTPDGKALIGGGPEHNPVVHMWDANTGKDLQHWDLTPLLKRGAPKESN
jgi:WD40 repeat protein